jgi:hypothetical protein
MERETRTTEPVVREEPRRTTVVREEHPVDRGVDVRAAAAGAIARDPITWGPIWAGVVTAFGLFILFSLLALAAGMALIEFNGPRGVGQDVPVDLVASIVTGLFLVAAFFAGGFVASWSAGLVEEGRGILHGFLVWALAMVLLLVFAAFGAGQLFGAAGEIFAFTPGQFDIDVDRQQLTEAAQAAAWQSLFAIFLALVAAVLGGFVGTMEQVSRRWDDYTARYRRR